MESEAKPFGFVGAGKMATALAKGWIQAGLVDRHHCIASDPLPETRSCFVNETGAQATGDNKEVARKSRVIILAVKPQDVNSVLDEIRGDVINDHLLISIAAGVSLKRIGERLPPATRTIRVMPNVACVVQATAAAFCPGPSASSGDIAYVNRLLNAVGRAFIVNEELLDAVTGLSGSGPAFVFTVIEALSDGGVLMGLPRDVATALAAQTVFGSAKIVLETGLHPAVLKDQVASPGGTTIAGMAAMERAGVRTGLIDAVAAATKRSQELGAER